METQSKIPPAKTDVENEMSSGPAAPNAVRSVNFILDPSAFTLGLGNIERWFNQEYFHSQVKDKNEKISLNLYLPNYTLHELDYQKRGPIVGSTKASQALKFIDRMLESDDGLPDDDFDESSTSEKKEVVNQFSHNLFIEHRTNQFPQWSTCASYQIRSPSPEDLPLHGKYSLYDEINHVGGGYGDSASEEREVPARLKHLIRSGIYLTRMKHNGPPGVTGDMWKLVSEDTVSKVWASCFGIDCLNINEAELLLFHGKDLTKFEIKDPGADFFAGQDVYQTEQPDSLHKKVNTTSYQYTDLKALEASRKPKGSTTKARSKKTKKGRNAEATVGKEGAKVEGGVITEDFNMINFAPRDSGSKLVVSTLFAKAKKPTSASKKDHKRASVKAGDENQDLSGTKNVDSKSKGKPKSKSARKPKKEKNGTASQQDVIKPSNKVVETPQVAQTADTEETSSVAKIKDPAQKKKTRKRSSKKNAAKRKDEGSKTDQTTESTSTDKPKTISEETPAS